MLELLWLEFHEAVILYLQAVGKSCGASPVVPTNRLQRIKRESRQYICLTSALKQIGLFGNLVPKKTRLFRANYGVVPTSGFFQLEGIGTRSPDVYGLHPYQVYKTKKGEELKIWLTS